jgi:hypothetical protein
MRPITKAVWGCARLPRVISPKKTTIHPTFFGASLFRSAALFQRFDGLSLSCGCLPTPVLMFAKVFIF